MLRVVAVTKGKLMQVNGKALEDWQGGEFVLVGEYRMSKAEVIAWRDKQTGVAKEAPMLRHTVEFGQVSAQVAERVPEGAKIESLSVPFTKGDKVACYLSELMTMKGQVSMRGKLVKLTTSPSPGKPAPVGGSVGSTR